MKCVIGELCLKEGQDLGRQTRRASQAGETPFCRMVARRSSHFQGEGVSGSSRTRTAVGCEGRICPEFGGHWADTEATSRVSIIFLGCFLTETSLMIHPICSPAKWLFWEIKCINLCKRHINSVPLTALIR